MTQALRGLLRAHASFARLTDAEFRRQPNVGLDTRSYVQGILLGERRGLIKFWQDGQIVTATARGPAMLFGPTDGHNPLVAKSRDAYMRPHNSRAFSPTATSIVQSLQLPKDAAVLIGGFKI